MFIKDKSNVKMFTVIQYNIINCITYSTPLRTVIKYELLSEMKTSTIYMTRNKLINNHITGIIVEYIK